MNIRLIDVTDQFDHEGIETLLFDIYVVDIDRYVGRCEYRNETGRDLYYYGNIGYVIYPPYRGHHYAYHACTRLFDVLRQKKPGLRNVIITCNPDNTPSQKTILRLGGHRDMTVDIAIDHELYALGEYQKEVYTVKL